MPTENELKYLLDASCEEQISQLATEKFDIVQGYFAVNVSNRQPMYTRVRSKNDKYFFTLKVRNEERTIEVEQEIDSRDFNDLWKYVKNSIKKIRYVIKNEDEYWELDFFKNDENKTYLAIAEVELPEGVTKPKSIPSFIKDNLTLNTPVDKNVYSNYSIAKFFGHNKLNSH